MSSINLQDWTIDEDRANGKLILRNKANSEEFVFEKDGSNNVGNTTEQVEDIVGAMVGHGLEYDDGNNVLSKTREGPNPYDAAQTFGESDVTVSTTDCAVKDGGITLSYGIWDVSTASYQTNLDVSAKESYPTGIQFNDTGSKLYIVGMGSNTVYSYSLSTAYDITTASYLSSFDVSGQSTDTQGMTLNSTGSKLYVVDNNTDFVYSYSLSTAYDITTASYLSGFDVSGQAPAPYDISFGNSGSKMYVLGASNNELYSYSLSTAYDITTASYQSSVGLSSGGSLPTGASFGDGGSRMLIVGKNSAKAFSYSLSTAYDITTASRESSFDLSGQDYGPRGGVAKSDGSAMWICGESVAGVYSYDIGVESLSGSVTISWPYPNDLYEWDVATFTRTLDNETVDVFVAYSTDGGSTWSRTNGGNPISRNYSLGDDSNISASDDVRIEAELSRSDTSNKPTLDSAMRSWFV